MPRTGSAYSLPVSADYPAVVDTPIDPDDHNSTLEDIATALTNSVPLDGSGTFTGNQPMGSHKLTGLAAGTTAGDSVRYEQVQLADAGLAAFVALGYSARSMAVKTGAAAWALVPSLAYGEALLNTASEAAFKALVNLEAGTDFLSPAAIAAAYQPLTANLTAFSGKTVPSGTVVGTTDAQALTNKNIRIPTSAETSGTLTSASANTTVECAGGVTLDDGAFTDGDYILFDPGTSNRTFTRATGLTMYVNGADSASATLSANQMGSAYWRSASVVVLSGAFS